MPASDRLLYVDVNGDGLRDVLDLEGGAGATLRINTGRGLAEAQPAYVFPPGAIVVSPYQDLSTSRIRVADFNHDGRDDFAVLFRDEEPSPGAPPEHYFIMHYSNGEAFEVQPWLLIPAEPFILEDEFGKVLATSWSSVQMGDPDGDGAVDVVVTNSDSMTLLKNQNRQPDLLSAVRIGDPAGLQADVLQIEYETATNGREIASVPSDRAARVLYTADPNSGPSSSGCVYPQQCVYRGVTVVSAHSEISAGLESGLSSHDRVRVFYEYSYEGGRGNGPAGMSLGFGRRTRRQWYWVVDGISWLRHDRQVTRWDYDLDAQGPDNLPALVGTPIAVEQFLVDPIDGRYRARRTEYDWQTVTVTGFAPELSFSQLPDTTVYDYDLPGPPSATLAGEAHFARRSRSVAYDEYSVPYQWTTTIESGDTEVLTATPGNFPDGNLFGRYARLTKSSTVAGLSEQQTVDLKYDPITGWMTRITLNVDDPEHYQVIERFPLGTTGLTQRIEQRAWDPESGPGGAELLRWVELDYDTEAVHPVAMRTSARGTILSTSLLYHPGLGLLQRVEAPTGAWVEYQHDRFGRPRGVQHSNGLFVNVNYLAGGTATDQYEVALNGSDGSEMHVWVDAFGNQRSGRMEGAQTGEWWVWFERRGLFGEVLESALPYREGETPESTAYQYDDLLRLVREVHPDGSETLRSFPDPFRVGTQLPSGRTITQRFEATGRLAELTEAPGAVTTYAYGPFGRLRTVDVPGPNAWQFEYDVNGNLDRREDLTTGVTEASYDGFSDLYSLRRDGVETKFRHDELGRLRERFDGSGTTQWQYDCGPTSLGLLCATTSPDWTTDTFTYGSGADAGQLVHRELSGWSDVVFDYTYLAGQLASIEVHGDAGGLTTGAHFDLAYDNGHWTGTDSREIGTRLWEALEVHPQGFVARERFANGIEVERDRAIESDRHLHHLSPVQDLNVEYDAELRVEHVDMSGPTADYTYDGRGRLDTWSWNGALMTTYQYDDAGNVLRSESGDMTYDAATGRITSALAQPVSLDGRGRVESALERTFSYTDFDLPERVTSDVTGDGVSFRYTADQARTAAVEDSGDWSAYGDDLYERRSAGGTTYEIFGVPGPERVVAELVSVDGAPPEVRYLHDDHLGSTAVVTDETGAVLTHAWFSPFGRRLKSSGAFTAPDSGITGPPRFTGHELDARLPMGGTAGAGLINMRGREYDPVLGRFLTPDPFVGYNGGGDGWNAFAYVNNNPTSFIDPSGFILCDELSPCGGGPFLPEPIGPDQGLGGPPPGWNPIPPGAFTPEVQDAHDEARHDFMRGAFSFLSGVFDGANPVTGGAAGPPHADQATIFHAGRVVGSLLGIAADVGLVLGGGVAIGAAAVGEVVTLGGATVPAVAVAGAGLFVAGAGIAGVGRHAGNLSDAIEELRRPQINNSTGRVDVGSSGVQEGTGVARGRAAPETSPLRTPAPRPTAPAAAPGPRGPVWGSLASAGRGGRRMSGTGSRRRYYEWDHTHGDIEVYDRRGNHLGSMHPVTGVLYKPAVVGRTIVL